MAIALYGSKGTISQAPIFYLSLTYITIFLAIGIPQVLSLKKIGDLSYGTYIFAWPIQKSVITALSTASPVLVTIISLPITLVLAYGSWRFVEQPMLELKRRLIKRQVKEVVPVSS